MNTKNEDYQRSIVYDSFQGTTNADTLLGIVGRRVAGPVLDVGAGEGSLKRALLRRGIGPVEGVDIAPRSADVKPGSITKLPFDGGRFQTVFCTEVLEHLEDDQIRAGAAEVARVLAPGGRWVVTVPFAEDLSRSAIACPECKCRFHRYGHRQTFTAGSFVARLGEAGFEPVFLKVYALGAMSVLPLGRYFNFFLKRLKFDFIANTLVAVLQRRGGVTSE